MQILSSGGVASEKGVLPTGLPCLVYCVLLVLLCLIVVVVDDISVKSGRSLNDNFYHTLQIKQNKFCSYLAINIQSIPMYSTSLTIPGYIQ